MKREFIGRCASAIWLLVAIATNSAAGETSSQPYWAWAFNGPATAQTQKSSAPIESLPLNDPTQHSLPGSSKSFTATEVANLSRYQPVDWFPEDHPMPVPEVVAHGKEAEGIYPCAVCHRLNGNGRPENAALTGLSYEYFMQQLMDFRNDLRQTSDPRKTNTAKMAAFVKALSIEELKASAVYYTAISAKPWIKVVETETVPKTFNRNDTWIVVRGADAGVEPLGRRIIETPANDEADLWKDPRSGFIAYVPRGSVKKGEALVKRGVTNANNKITPCTVCHGDDLRGLGPVPRLAGRSASYTARQLYDMQKGNRAGPWSVLMAPVLSELDAEDLLTASAYLASLDP